MANKAKYLLRSVLRNTYSQQEEAFLENRELIHVSNILCNANAIDSSVKYIIKVLSNGARYRKAKIAHYGIHASKNNNLKPVL